MVYQRLFKVGISPITTPPTLWILLKLYIRVPMGMYIIIPFNFLIFRFITHPPGYKIKSVKNVHGKI